MTAPKWFRKRVSDGLIRFVSLSLPGVPSNETIGLTKEFWIDVLWDAKHWEEELDAQRITNAFRSLAIKADRWPLPRHLVDNLPPRLERKKLALTLSPEQRATNRQRLKAMMEEVFQEKEPDESSITL